MGKELEKNAKSTKKISKLPIFFHFSYISDKGRVLASTRVFGVEYRVPPSIEKSSRVRVAQKMSSSSRVSSTSSTR